MSLGSRSASLISAFISRLDGAAVQEYSRPAALARTYLGPLAELDEPPSAKEPISMTPLSARFPSGLVIEPTRSTPIAEPFQLRIDMAEAAPASIWIQTLASYEPSAGRELPLP